MKKSELISLALAVSLIIFSGCTSQSSTTNNSTTTTVQITNSTTINSTVQASTVKVSMNTSLGNILVDGEGMTLYVYANDSIGKSTCYDQCARAWPPFLVKGKFMTPSGVTGNFATTLRTDGSVQVTYNGFPLYYWFKDKKPGDVSGEGVQGVWYVVSLPTIANIPGEAKNYSSDWPLANKDYGNSRSTIDSSINSGNVASLAMAWSFVIPGVGAYGGGASNPLILGDTVFFQDMRANVFALNLKDGQKKWERIYNVSAVIGPNGPAAAYGKIFVAKDLYNMTALDINTGDEIWSTRLSYVDTTGIDIQPTAYDGMVYASTVPGTGDLFYAPGGVGIIYALDQSNGAVRWNFSTVDTPKLWGHPEINSGGGCWYTPAIDVSTGVTYWGIANPAPFPGNENWTSGSSRPGPDLYTDSMIALDHKTGMMYWYKQVLPHDLFDFDFQIAPMLAKVSMYGLQRDIVIGAGKMGRVYAFDRNTGEILWVTPVGEHNENDQLDRIPAQNTRIIPSALGGVETPMAYSDGIVYVPVVDLPMNWTNAKLDFSSVDFSQGKGEIVALDAGTGKIMWYKVFDSLNVGGATVVNDLVFTATYDGMIYAFRKDTGEELLRYKTPAGINAWPAVSGDTIIWPAGVGGTPSLVALRPGAAAGAVTNPAVSLAPKSKKNYDVKIKNLVFSPANIKINVGDTVTWTNLDNTAHTVVSDSGRELDSTKDSKGDPQLTTGEKYSHTFMKPGTYDYHCSVHPTMEGSVVVK